MIVFLVHWKIKPNKIEDFYKHYRSTITIDNREELVGEFICEVTSKEELKYVTWTALSSPEVEVGETDPKYRSFVHVGFWKSLSAFEEQVAFHFIDTAPVRDFEYERRIRTIARPRVWRMGDAVLPRHDSGGVI